MAQLGVIDHLPRLIAGEWRGVALALLVAAASAWLGARRRWRALVLAACGLGVLAGWTAVLGLAERRFLPLALAALGVVLLGAARPPGRAAKGHGQGTNRWVLALLGLLACCAGWWLAGAPRGTGGIIAAWKAEAVTLGLVVALGVPLLGADRWRVAACAAGLASAFGAIGGAGHAPVLAFVLAAAALGARGLARPEIGLLPAIVGIGLLAASAILVNGRLLHGHAAPVQAVVLAPLATHWFASRFLPRLRRAGGAAPALASLAALLLTTLLGFSAAALAGLR
jgi:hypothetical protein